MEKSKKGFTLIELLVVIAIIVLLTGIITSNFTQSKAKSRDAKRVSDLAQLQLSLELFFDRCSAYPASLSTGASATGCSATLGMFIGQIPNPPTSVSGDSYTYTTNGSPALDYVLRARLESNSSVLNDDVDGTVFSSVDCSDSSSNYYYCVQPR